MYAGITLYKDCEILISQINYDLLHLSEAIISITHTLSVEAFLTLRTLTPFGKWNSWFSKSVLKNVVCVRGSVKDMPTSLTTDVLSFSTLSLVVPCWNTTWNKIHKEESSWSANMMSRFLCFYFAQCSVSIYSVNLTGLLFPTRTKSWSLRPPTVLLCSGWTMPMSAFCLKRNRPFSWNSILSHPFGPIRITVHITRVIWATTAHFKDHDSQFMQPHKEIIICQLFTIIYRIEYQRRIP